MQQWYSNVFSTEEKISLQNTKKNRYSFIDDAYNNAIENFKSTTCTESEKKSLKLSSIPSENISKKGRRWTLTSHYEPKTPKDKKKKVKWRVCKKTRYTKEDITLAKGKLKYQDVEFQLKTDHIEYVNLLSRHADQKIHHLILQNIPIWKIKFNFG